jgi:LPXTG-motif cell wall-anchored protein
VYLRRQRKELAMNRFTLVLAALGVALLVPATAAAKGPSGASISGSPLAKTIKLGGNGEMSGTPLGSLTEQSGFFPAAFGQSPDPRLPKRPSGNLGPKLTIHYVVPGPDSATFRIFQEAYPYADGGAVTYMKPGQPIFDMKTVGGWIRAWGLKETLVRQGLPAQPPSDSSGSNLALLAGIGIPGALALAGAGLFYRRRRR